MHPSRRDALRLGAGVGLSSLAGCSGLPVVGRSKLSLVMLNWDTREHLLRVQLLRPDRDTDDAASVESVEHLLEPPDEDGNPGVVEERDLVPARRYLVRAELAGNTGDAGRHAHYVPPERGDSSDGGPELYVEIRAEEGEPRLEIH